MTAVVLLVDHRDSFVYNLARYCRELGRETAVVRAEELDVAAVLAESPSHIVLSPGPGTPKAAAPSLELTRLAGPIPVLGVCLGHQCVAAAFGAQVTAAARPRHGRSVRIEHMGEGIFREMPQGFRAGLYHSLAVVEAGLPECLEIVARSEDGAVMALRHRELPVWGVQFHPESVLTEHGHLLLRNFLELAPATGGATAPTRDSLVAP